jgi:hypothetical protein
MMPNEFLALTERAIAMHYARYFVCTFAAALRSAAWHFLPLLSTRGLPM